MAQQGSVMNVYEVIEYGGIVADLVLSYGWLIFAFSCLYVFRKWLLSNKD